MTDALSLIKSGVYIAMMYWPPVTGYYIEKGESWRLIQNLSINVADILEVTMFDVFRKQQTTHIVIC